MTIRVIDLEKRHPGSGAPALRGLSLHVPQGHVASVLGKSGAGKTTLLRCLVGLDPFDKGSIEIGGLTVGPGPRSGALGKVGLVFQSFELFPHLSVLDNCTLAPIRAHGKPRAAAETLARDLLDRLGLADKADEFPESLSGGQRQRVAIARALAVEPRVLLYDEPTSALDPSLKQEVGRSLRRVASTGVTQILVTHDVEVAREASDVVFVLEAGRVARSGPPGEVLGAPGGGEEARTDAA
jgi:ABC-type polar amino acid transport system ATPase subunit